MLYVAPTRCTLVRTAVRFSDPPIDPGQDYICYISNSLYRPIELYADLSEISFSWPCLLSFRNLCPFRIAAAALVRLLIHQTPSKAAT
jgi:hypothetical protein